MELEKEWDNMRLQIKKLNILENGKMIEKMGKVP